MLGSTAKKDRSSSPICLISKKESATNLATECIRSSFSMHSLTLSLATVDANGALIWKRRFDTSFSAGKYINVWLGTCGTDGVRNIEKLAILEKVLRRNNVIDDYLKLGPNEWDLVCNTTCQKYKNAVDALYSYKKDSNPMNLYLSGLKLSRSCLQYGL